MAYLIRQPQFGYRIRQLRAQRGLSQRQLASDTVSASYVSLIESGIRTPSAQVVVHFARILRMPLSELVNSADLLLDDPDRARAAAQAGPRGAYDEIDRLVREFLARGADPGEVRAHLVAAYRDAADRDDPVAMLRCGTVLQRYHSLEGDEKARLRLMAELSGAATASGTAEFAVRAATDHAAAARDAGHYPQAQEQLSVAARLIDHGGLSGSMEHLRLLSVEVSVLAEVGDRAGVLSRVDALLDVAETAEPFWRGRALWAAGVALGRAGETGRTVTCVRAATRLLAGPDTSATDWARFLRSAVSALLDAGADLAEVERYVHAARTVLGAPGEDAVTAVLRARYALARGDAATAWQISCAVPDDAVSGYELIRLVLTRGRAAAALGRVDEALDRLRAAARCAEEMSAFQLAARIWRELDDLRPR